MLTSPEVAVSRNPSLGGTIVRKSWSFVISEFSIVESVDSTASVADKCTLHLCDEECSVIERVVKAEATEMIAIAHIVQTATEIEAAIVLCFIVVGLYSEVIVLLLSMIHFGFISYRCSRSSIVRVVVGILCNYSAANYFTEVKIERR